MKKVSLFPAVFALIAVTFTPGFCQGTNTTQSARAPIKTFEGQVIDIDWVGGKIALRTDTQYGVDEKVFQFSRTMPVTKGVETVGVQDINISDNVIIRYSVDQDGNFNAESISIVQQ